MIDLFWISEIFQSNNSTVEFSVAESSKFEEKVSSV